MGPAGTRRRWLGGLRTGYDVDALVAGRHPLDGGRLGIGRDVVDEDGDVRALLVRYAVDGEFLARAALAPVDAQFVDNDTAAGSRRRFGPRLPSRPVPGSR